MSRAKRSGQGRERSKESGLWFIPCSVQPGMFKGEWLVYVFAADPTDPKKTFPVKLFADERDVTCIQGSPERDKPAKALLRVDVANRAGGLAEVIFPQPAQPVGESAFFDENLLKQETGV